MQTPLTRLGNTYQLVLAEDGQGCARTIEFEAFSTESALFMARQQCGHREAELLQDGRSLGRLRCASNGGYWIISPPARLAS